MTGRSLLLVVFTAAHLVAQVDRATLSGTITDTSGAIVPDAGATVESPDTGLRRVLQRGDRVSPPFGIPAVRRDGVGFD